MGGSYSKWGPQADSTGVDCKLIINAAPQAQPRSAQSETKAEPSNLFYKALRLILLLIKV